MYLDEIKITKNLSKILKTLKEVYNVRLDFDVPVSELEEVYESWAKRKTEILLEDAYNAYNNNPEYAQATLICEAVRLFLSEIAPARKGARVRTKKMQKAQETMETMKFFKGFASSNTVENKDYLKEITDLSVEMNGGRQLFERVIDEDLQDLIDQYPRTDKSKVKVAVFNAPVAGRLIISLFASNVEDFSTDYSKTKFTDIAYFDSKDDAVNFLVTVKTMFSGNDEYGIQIQNKLNESLSATTCGCGPDCACGGACGGECGGVGCCCACGSRTGDVYSDERSLPIIINETQDGYEIEAEADFGDNMWTDAPQSFDGEDQTDGYEDDRDPNGDHGYDNFDYDADANWVADDTILLPEIGDDDSETTLPSGTEYNEDSVVDRYESGPGPVSGDYADDRNPEIFKHSDELRTVEDPTAQLAKATKMPGKETKTGLPADLEKGFEGNYNSGNKKNGVNDNVFNQDPSKTPQRDIPKSNDLQNKNHDYYNGGEQSKATKATNPLKGNTEKPAETPKKKPQEKPEVNFKPKDDSRPKDKEAKKIALKVMNKLNEAQNIGNVKKAIQSVSLETSYRTGIIVETYKKYGKAYLGEHAMSFKDAVYHEAMISTVEILGSKNLRPMLESAQKTNDDTNLLFNFLINKAKALGFKGNEANQFALAAHGTLLEADLAGFQPGRSLWEQNDE